MDGSQGWLDVLGIRKSVVPARIRTQIVQAVAQYLHWQYSLHIENVKFDRHYFKQRAINTHCHMNWTDITLSSVLLIRTAT
jgi:hypothetical protein